MSGLSVAPAPLAPTPPAAASGGRAAGRGASILLALSLALAAIVAAAALLGYRGEAILTGSMRPALDPGDLVVVERIAAAQMRPGDVVSFRAPSGVTITHRVKAVAARRDGLLRVTTQGDANNVAEAWTTSPRATVGRVSARLPGAGGVLRWTGSPTGRLIVLGAIGALAAWLALRRIWRAR